MHSNIYSGEAGTLGEFMNNLDNDVKIIVENLVKKQQDFDSVMALVRDIVRNSAQAITMLHNNKINEASKAIDAAEKMSISLKKFGPDFDYHAKQAYQEYTEARIFLEIKQKHALPSYKKINVDQESYLMGLMDVMGELKREILESLREGKVKEAESYFDSMREIYDSTRSIRFAEAVLNGFRRKQDVARIQLESAGSEILSFKRK
jgi:translin